jgi:hypothetical protein
MAVAMTMSSISMTRILTILRECYFHVLKCDEEEVEVEEERSTKATS